MAKNRVFVMFRPGWGVLVALVAALGAPGCGVRARAENPPTSSGTSSSSVPDVRVAGEQPTKPSGLSTAPGSSDPVTPEDDPMVSVRVFDAAGELVGPISMPKVVKPDAEWRKLLTPEQYRITRAARAPSEPSAERCSTTRSRASTRACAAGCRSSRSASKFHSGTGWPSFFQPIARENVAEIADESHGMVRTEINCARCDGHLGHVFEDGPQPTGLRYCVNSESLAFTAIDDVKALADPAVAGDAPEGARATVVIGGGCFWCVEAVFEELDGVSEAISGYAGGSKDTANYEAVSTGRTGHAEAVEIVYDPEKISYEELLAVHFATHDPTTLNRQGADVGTQYRSVVFYANDQEKELAQAVLDDLRASGTFDRPIVTTLEPLQAFYPAETYHQNYVCLNPSKPYVRGVALPKVEKVRAKFREKLKQESPLGK